MKRAYPDPLPLPYDMPVFPDGHSDHVCFSHLAYAVLDSEGDGRLERAAREHSLPSRFKGTEDEKVLAYKIFDFTHDYLTYRTGYQGFGTSYPKEKGEFHKRLDITAGEVLQCAAKTGKDGEACVGIAMQCVEDELQQRFGTLAKVGTQSGKHRT